MCVLPHAENSGDKRSLDATLPRPFATQLAAARWTDGPTEATGHDGIGELVSDGQMLPFEQHDIAVLLDLTDY